MQFSAIALASILATLANGAIVEFYTDGNCQDSYGSRNVYDNTCATGVGAFQSYMVTTAGSNGQILAPFNRDACAGPEGAWQYADQVGTCFQLVGLSSGWNGDANAISSYAGP